MISDVVGLEAKQLKSIDKNFNTHFIVPEAEQKNNISVDSVFIEQTLDNFYEIGVKLSAHGEDFKDIPIALYNKGKLIAKTLVKPDAGEKTIQFTIPKEDFHGYVSINDNGLEYDNTFYFSISKPEKINVLSIGETAKSNFLARIYTSDEFNFNNFPLENLDYNLLEKQDAIVLNELNKIPQALQTTLKSFVEKGGNVVVIPSIDNTADLNALLAIFGNIKFKNLQQQEKLITRIAFNNPVFRSVFEKQVSNFQYPNTRSSFAVDSPYPAILAFEDQSAFLTAIENPLSAVYVFTAAINKTNSNFQNSPLVVPSFYNMAHHSQKTGVSAFIIGANNPILIDALLAKDEIVNIKNQDEKFIPVQQILNNKVRITCNDYPQQAGNFGIYKQNELFKNVSFNYDRSESNLSNKSENLLTDFQISDSVQTLFDNLQTDRTHNEIWKWFVIFTLLFLVTELLIQKLVK